MAERVSSFCHSHARADGRKHTGTKMAPLHPLVEALHPDRPTAMMVVDRVETDGRFVLYQCCASTQPTCSVLWLTCGATHLVVSSLRKLSAGRNNNNAKTRTESHFVVHSISDIMEELILRRTEEKNEVTTSIEDLAQKRIQAVIKDWVNGGEDANSMASKQKLVIVDDVACLMLLLGTRRAYSILLSLRQRVAVDDGESTPETESLSMIFRCSGDEQVDDEEEWLGSGAGGSSNGGDSTTHFSHLQCMFVELADCIVDVMPLSSGYSRETHGRLVITDHWEETQRQYNYVLLDDEVKLLPRNVGQDQGVL